MKILTHFSWWWAVSGLSRCCLVHVSDLLTLKIYIINLDVICKEVMCDIFPNKEFVTEGIISHGWRCVNLFLGWTDALWLSDSPCWASPTLHLSASLEKVDKMRAAYKLTHLLLHLTASPMHTGALGNREKDTLWSLV